MNTDRLSELTKFLLASDGNLALQQELEKLRSLLDNLTNNPSEPSFQQDVSQSLNNLDRSLQSFEEGLTPARIQSIREIQGSPYFSRALPAGIRTLMASNGVTPSVVRDRVAELVSERRAYIDTLGDARRSLESLGAGEEPTLPGSAELGFLIPRSLFKNSLDGFSSELSQINRIIGVFSELTTGVVEPVEVHQISTTDPLIFLGIPVATAATIGTAIKFALDSWKTALEIKILHDQSKSLKMPDGVLEAMKAHMKQIVDDAIAEHAEKLLTRYPQEEARANELRNGLRWAMQALIAKVERGMTVEVRMLPPPPPEDGQPPSDDAAAFAELGEIALQLEFPKITGEPLIPLAASPEDSGTPPAAH